MRRPEHDDGINPTAFGFRHLRHRVTQHQTAHAVRENMHVPRKPFPAKPFQKMLRMRGNREARSRVIAGQHAVSRFDKHFRQFPHGIRADAPAVQHNDRVRAAPRKAF